VVTAVVRWLSGSGRTKSTLRLHEKASTRFIGGAENAGVQMQER